MKRYLTLLLCIFTVCACDININEINLIPDNLELDSGAQTVAVTADHDIVTIGCDIADTDSESHGESYVDGVFIRTGDWFRIEFTYEHPREIIVKVDENDSGKDRKVSIYATRRAGSADCIITQKSK